MVWGGERLLHTWQSVKGDSAINLVGPIQQLADMHEKYFVSLPCNLQGSSLEQAAKAGRTSLASFVAEKVDHGIAPEGRSVFSLNSSLSLTCVSECLFWNSGNSAIQRVAE